MNVLCILPNEDRCNCQYENGVREVVLLINYVSLGGIDKDITYRVQIGISGVQWSSF